MGNNPSKAGNAGAFQTIRRGDQGEAVRGVQRALASRGYRMRAVDGVFGQETFQAVQTFQRDHGLAADGKVGRATAGALLGIAAFAAVSSAAFDGPAVFQTVRLGDRGEAVSAIQRALESRGYRIQAIDGVFGQETLGVVRAFQRDHRLTADGKVGRVTAGLLGLAAGPSGASAAQTAKGTVASHAAPSKGAQSLDWYADGRRLVKRHKSITIDDLNTGVTWNASYINGESHADVIPASAADARKIADHRIGGSYARRPVIATINGAAYAGSMYAVAHGETSYCAYFSGVMCLHFTGSKTHGSQKVDADHQKTIAAALRAGKK